MSKSSIIRLRVIKYLSCLYSAGFNVIEIDIFPVGNAQLQ